MEGTPVELHVIRLTFDYVKKNRRERAYVMEDPASAEVGTRLLPQCLLSTDCSTRSKPN